MYIIEVKEINVDVFVGLKDTERSFKSPIIVDVKIFCKTEDMPYNTKILEQSIDYLSLCNYIKGWTNKSHVDLLETLRKELLAFCFADKRVTKAVVMIKRKVNNDGATVGVGAEIERNEFENLI